jgi:ABC-type methionine transport system permease subunit
VPRELLDVGVASGASRWQIIRSIQLTEGLPGIAAGLTLNMIAMIEYSAIAGAIGAGGLGYLAVNDGYEQFDSTIMISCIALLILVVQVIQFTGDRVVRSLLH